MQSSSSRLKKASDLIREIEIEFGFRLYKKKDHWKVRKMASNIFFLRKTKSHLESENKYLKDRVRELELQIADMDYMIRGEE